MSLIGITNGADFRRPLETYEPGYFDSYEDILQFPNLVLPVNQPTQSSRRSYIISSLDGSDSSCKMREKHLFIGTKETSLIKHFIQKDQGEFVKTDETTTPTDFSKNRKSTKDKSRLSKGKDLLKGGESFLCNEKLDSNSYVSSFQLNKNCKGFTSSISESTSKKRVKQCLERNVRPKSHSRKKPKTGKIEDCPLLLEDVFKQSEIYIKQGNYTSLKDLFEVVEPRASEFSKLEQAKFYYGFAMIQLKGGHFQIALDLFAKADLAMINSDETNMHSEQMKLFFSTTNLRQAEAQFKLIAERGSCSFEELNKVQHAYIKGLATALLGCDLEALGKAINCLEALEILSRSTNQKAKFQQFLCTPFISNLPPHLLCKWYKELINMQNLYILNESADFIYA